MALTFTSLTKDCTRYEYVELPEGETTRILTLLPGEPTELVRCTLETVPLQDAGEQYEALSYTWGDPTDLRLILIDNAELMVTANLFDALCRLRHRDAARKLWVDAICINQADTVERGRHVQLMGRIYEHAKRVPIWLGRDDTSVAKQTFDFFRRSMELIRGLRKVHISIEAFPSDSTMAELQITTQQWTLVRQMASLPWFSRVWVVQEVGLAADATFYWGAESLPFSEFVNLVEASTYPFMPFLYPFAIVHDAYGNAWVTYGNNTSWDSWQHKILGELSSEFIRLRSKKTLVNVLLTGARRKATDARDHVYSFLGHPLAFHHSPHSPQKPLLAADYSSTIADVYVKTAIALTQHSDPDFMLSCTSAMGRHGLDDEFPSWVPQWNLGRQSTALAQPHLFYRAGGRTSQFRPTIDEARRALVTECYIVNTVKWISGVVAKETIDVSAIRSTGIAPAFPRIWSALEALSGSGYATFTKQEHWDAYTMTLVAGLCDGDFAGDGRLLREHRSRADAYQDKLMHKPDALETQYRLYEGDFIWAAAERQFFVAGDGSFGLGPALMEVDDIVVVCLGAKVPFVLRPMQGRNCYKFVGTCYLHGIMAGELFDEPRQTLQDMAKVSVVML